MKLEKVRVIGVDDTKVQQHSTNPLYIELPFVLSSNPDETWIGICVSEYGNMKPPANRRMFITNNLITIVANIDDNLEDHKQTVEKVVNETNQKYYELHQKTKKQEEQIKKELQENEMKLAGFKEKAKKLYRS